MSRFFITRYALTMGVYAVEARDCEDGMIEFRPSGGCIQYFHTEGRDWHRTFDAAVARAEELRAAKIKSVEKQLAKLRALKFVES